MVPQKYYNNFDLTLELHMIIMDIRLDKAYHYQYAIRKLNDYYRHCTTWIIECHKQGDLRYIECLDKRRKAAHNLISYCLGKLNGTFGRNSN